MSTIRVGLSIAGLVAMAIAATTIAARWERGQAATWLKFPRLGPPVPTGPDFTPLAPGGINGIDRTGWATARLGVWEAEFPGQPADVNLKSNNLSLGVRTASPFEGYAIQDLTTFGTSRDTRLEAMNRFATLHQLGRATSETIPSVGSTSPIERRYSTRHGELTLRATRRRGAGCLMIALGPESRRFLDSLRDTRPPAPRPADPASIPGLVARWPLDDIRGAALQETVAGSTAVVPRDAKLKVVPGRATDGTAVEWSNSTIRAKIEFDLPTALAPESVTICWWCRSGADWPPSPLGIRNLPNGPSLPLGAWPGEHFPPNPDREWVHVSVCPDVSVYAVSFDGEMHHLTEGHQDGPVVGLDWQNTPGVEMTIRDLCVYDRVLTDLEILRLAGKSAP